jgi:hypothetical protein
MPLSMIVIPNGSIGDLLNQIPRLISPTASPSWSWSDLLPDLLGRVIADLPFPTDRARFRAVCRAWHSAAHQHMRRQLPWLVFPDGSFCTVGADGQRGFPILRRTYPSGRAVDKVPRIVTRCVRRSHLAACLALKNANRSDSAIAFTRGGRLSHLPMAGCPKLAQYSNCYVH